MLITKKMILSSATTFLMCAHRLALEHIRHYGFYSYNYIFDESYDELDNVVRMKDMVDSNWRFTHEQISTVEKQKIYQDLQELINYNRDYFFNHLGDQIIDELRMDLLNLWGK